MDKVCENSRALLNFEQFDVQFRIWKFAGFRGHNCPYTFVLSLYIPTTSRCQFFKSISKQSVCNLQGGPGIIFEFEGTREGPV